jgi:hypothetical protein
MHWTWDAQRLAEPVYFYSSNNGRRWPNGIASHGVCEGIDIPINRLQTAPPRHCPVRPRAVTAILIGWIGVGVELSAESGFQIPHPVVYLRKRFFGANESRIVKVPNPHNWQVQSLCRPGRVRDQFDFARGGILVDLKPIRFNNC